MSLTRHAEQLNEWTGSYRYTEMEVVIVHTTVSTIISVSKQLKEFPLLFGLTKLISQCSPVWYLLVLALVICNPNSIELHGPLKLCLASILVIYHKNSP